MNCGSASFSSKLSGAGSGREIDILLECLEAEHLYLKGPCPGRQRAESVMSIGIRDRRHCLGSLGRSDGCARNWLSGGFYKSALSEGCRSGCQ